ncbi:GTP 3',8-cyclase MoaA [Ferrimonas sediminicola]|uniref:GTP 3',8-cyclase n=1 Tax=Ferrimonas sediminicola TaxID=2569538 RepID=A0A4U1BLT4_9GAMM|nr:GTP 3',8-cyclase MoaA [Ferrimonas sediminicola]TKB51068.1 GTP 3',8-cyclase MoaA [Ferrimonas sediminicola]
MTELHDRFGREFHYLRLSITDACNFKCQYCLPDGYRPDGKPRFMTLDEIRRVITAFAQVGTRKIRITGGEPTMRKDFSQVIELAANTPGVNTVATTTNGYRLAANAQRWFDLGLSQINVSLDSMDEGLFRQITGDGRQQLVLDGIEAALDAGYRRVKINVVLLKDLNAQQLPQFLDYIRRRPVDIRFIELMETGLGQDYFQKHHVSGQVIKQQLLAQGWREDPRGPDDGPAQNFIHPDYAGRIGLIMPYAKDFCATCNRLRVSSIGKLHLCLFTECGIELRDLLGHDDHQPQLIARLHEQLRLKGATHQLHQGLTGVTQHLASIGG